MFFKELDQSKAPKAVIPLTIRVGIKEKRNWISLFQKKLLLLIFHMKWRTLYHHNLKDHLFQEGLDERRAF